MKQRESAIRNELERLARQHGGVLKPETVVDAARDEESPLHDSFEWDDSKAAQSHRLWQARQLISVVVRYEPTEKGIAKHRVFVSLTPDRKEDGAGYRLVTTVLSDAALRAQMLADARAEMLLFRAKYRDLEELAKVFEAMDAAQEQEAIAS